ncbi:MAG: hypothetical protein TR69_WS6001001534 [candidate division WS6 bacterium OLB20]|uniref:Uncharacterized protein n=1 Tax=candidate division WS6 bacterium OLB20 TaxID=1617426 RepID=A0A136LVQ1_9BACT|nr:MAG: hypothetical protein TR69_WS6001001534 [candidate division WS6 bacterium OLB20]
MYVDQQNNTAGQYASLPPGDYQFERIELTRAGLLAQLGQSSVLTLVNSDSLVGDSSASDLLIYGTLVAPQTFTINGVEVDINGEINLGGDNTSADLILGNTVTGGIKLRANTWAHNQTNQYQFNAIHVASQGRLTLYSYQNGNTLYTDDWGLTLQAELLRVDAGGRVIGDGLGYPGSRGPGFVSGQGGSYGGQGFGAPTSAIYGSVYTPDALGSGSVFAGGGAIRLDITGPGEVGQLINNGSITANGSGGDSAAGSGGSIWINADTIGGTGSITANGGSTSNASRPGSGGRIAVYYRENGDAINNIPPANFDPSLGNISAAGGRGNFGGWWGGPGTIYIDQIGLSAPERGLLYVDQQNNSSGYSAGLPQGNYQFERVKLTRAGQLIVLGQASNLTITDSDGLTGDSSFPNLRIDGTFNAPNSITISGVDVDINGEMNFGINSDADLTVGGVERGGLTLRASTWAHDADTPYELGDLTVNSNGTLTLISHNNGDTNYTNDWGLTLLLKNMYIANGGVVTADSLGYSPDRGPGYVSGNAGSYGGQGGGAPLSSIYGDVYAPVHLGSGGDGFAGGGAIRLVIDDGNGGGDFVVNGSIRSSGAGGGADAGSGGSIYVTTHLLGGTGSISASGGSTSNASQPGGGGRIALYFSENGDTNRSIAEFDYNPLGGHISAVGGRGNFGSWWGGPGSIYIEQAGVHQSQGGLLYIDQQNNSNGHSSGLPEGEYTFAAINLTRAGRLSVIGQNSVVNIADSNGITGDASYPDLTIYGTLNGPDPLYINGYDLNVAGVLSLGDSTEDADIVIGDVLPGGMVLYGNTWSNNTGEYEFSDLRVASSGVLTLSGYNDGDTDYSDGDRGVTLRLDRMEVEAGGLVTASGLGYGADRGPGYATNGPGVYGGYASGGGNPYGDFRYPLHLGSGGGTASGGGAIRLIIDDGSSTGTLLNNGTIAANGSGTDGNALDPGAGGSILVEADIVGGSGSYTAIGGSGGNGGTAGSGGRIAVHTNFNGDSDNGIAPLDLVTFSRFNAAGGRGQYGSFWGGPGTVYVEVGSEYNEGYGDLYISNSSQYSNGGYADNLPAGISNFHNVYIGTNVHIRPAVDTNANRGSILQVEGDFTLSSGAVIDGVGRGFSSSTGPGTGAAGAGQSGGAGGAHGGNGGNGENDGGNPSPSGGTAYGSQREPVTLGSGGGPSGAGAAGGRGGGAVASGPEPGTYYQR